jgi:hypothetical protein
MKRLRLNERIARSSFFFLDARVAIRNVLHHRVNPLAKANNLLAVFAAGHVAQLPIPSLDQDMMTVSLLSGWVAAVTRGRASRRIHDLSTN